MLFMEVIPNQGYGIYRNQPSFQTSYSSGNIFICIEHFQFGNEVIHFLKEAQMGGGVGKRTLQFF